MAAYLCNIVKGRGPFDRKKIESIRRWLDADWESHDHDPDLIKLVKRLVETVDGLQETYETEWWGFEHEED